MYKPAPDTGKVNRSFSAEERDFWNSIPDDVKPYLTQEMADALFSTSYNIGAGNFKKRVVPKLRSVLVNGKGTVADITNAMYGTRDSEPKMKGLRTRRAKERQLFAEAYEKAYGHMGNPSVSEAQPYMGMIQPIVVGGNVEQPQFNPWWSQNTPEAEAEATQYANLVPDFSQFNLGWDPINGRKQRGLIPGLMG
jgi:hypothetical protein